MMISSALVSARNSDSPRATSSGPPTIALDSTLSKLFALERAQGRDEAIGIDGRRHRAELAAAQREEHLLVGSEEPPGFLVGVGRDDVDAEQHVRALERARDRLRAELAAVDVNRPPHRLRRRKV